MVIEGISVVSAQSINGHARTPGITEFNLGVRRMEGTHACAKSAMTSGLDSSGSHFFPMLLAGAVSRSHWGAKSDIEESVRETRVTRLGNKRSNLPIRLPC